MGFTYCLRGGQLDKLAHGRLVGLLELFADVYVFAPVQGIKELLDGRVLAALQEAVHEDGPDLLLNRLIPVVVYHSIHCLLVQTQLHVEVHLRLEVNVAHHKVNMLMVAVCDSFCGG